MSQLTQARTAYRSPAARSVPRPSMGVLYTDRPRGYGEAVVLPEPVLDDDADNLPENSHPTLPESDPSVTSRQLLKNLRPRLRYLQQTDRILRELAMTGERSKRDVARMMNGRYRSSDVSCPERSMVAMQIGIVEFAGA